MSSSSGRHPRATPRILVVDDERAIREEIGEELSDAGFDVVLARNADLALTRLGRGSFQLVLCDIRMPGIDGLALLREIRAKDQDVDVILMTAFASIDSAVEALKLGAADYLLKPLVIDALIARVRHLLSFRELSRENLLLRTALDSLSHDHYSGTSASSRELTETVSRVATTDSPVMILGESGTGKDVCARAIHRQSELNDQPLVVASLGGVPAASIETRLFGVPGKENHGGLLQAAAGGTVFLDEVGDLSPEVQSKLLRLIEGAEASESARPQVRLLSATNRDLEAAIRAGTFRSDLYYRLAVVELRLLPLRELREDIPGLAHFLLNKLNRSLKTNYREVTPQAMVQLLDHDWPGNVRELQNVLERAMILGDSEVVRARDLPHPIGREQEVEYDLRKVVRAFERDHIRRALVAADWSRKAAAELLGISTTSLWRRMTELGIEEPAG